MKPDAVSSKTLDQVLRLMNATLASADVEQCCQNLLPHVLSLAEVAAGFVQVSDPRLPTDHLVSEGLSTKHLTAIEDARWEWFDRLADATASEPISVQLEGDGLIVFPLLANERILGTIGWIAEARALDGKTDLWERMLDSLGSVFDCLAAKASLQRKLKHFDTFQEVSSLLAKPVGLSESLELALFSSMTAVSAEAASILLLDESKETFRFFHVEGAVKPSLGETSFSARDGIAGRVLQTQEAEIVNDVSEDVQFYGRIDAETGFQTRNLIAVPLIAGNDPIGVLEVLNRSGGDAFTAEDRLLLVSLADQIAYAIRNATIFDWVIDTYCQRRQDAESCDDCPQPLDSWAPCVEYRSRHT